MRSYNKLVWVADDGREFEDDKACRAYEETAKIVEWLKNDPDIFWPGGTEVEAVVKSLLVRYTITERP